MLYLFLLVAVHVCGATEDKFLTSQEVWKSMMFCYDQILQSSWSCFEAHANHDKEHRCASSLKSLNFFSFIEMHLNLHFAHSTYTAFAGSVSDPIIPSRSPAVIKPRTTTFHPWRGLHLLNDAITHTNPCCGPTSLSTVMTIEWVYVQHATTSSSLQGCYMNSKVTVQDDMWYYILKALQIC